MEYYRYLSWIAKNEYSKLKSLLDKLVDGIHKYMNYLTRKNDEMQEAHKRGTIRIISDNIELRTIHPECVDSVNLTYRCIVDALHGKDEYHSICFNEIVPTDRYQH